MFYKCEHFRIEELVSQEVHRMFGEAAWMFLRPELLKTLDRVRDRYNRGVTVNNWKWGGPLSQRGFRAPGDDLVGARFSQHKFGGAADFNVDDLSADEVRADILAHPDDKAFELINCIEADVGWVHIDCRNIENRILVVRP